MQSIFRYPGGKTRKSVRAKILAKAPSNFKEFREPFVGGGGIFFSIDPSIKRWINDIDPYLMSVYHALKTRPDAFIAACRAIKPALEGEDLTAARPGGKPLYNARLKAVFDHFARKDIVHDEAIRYFFVNRTVWAGRVNYEIESRMYFSVPEGWNIVNTNKLEEAAHYCKDTIVSTGCYNSLLEQDGEDVWIYCDPPYLVNTELDRNSQLYRFGFTKEDHKKFADAVKACKHKVCISYDDDEYIRSLYDEFGFNLTKESWTYCGTSSAENQSKQKKIGKELLICNY